MPSFTYTLRTLSTFVVLCLMIAIRPIKAADPSVSGEWEMTVHETKHSFTLTLSLKAKAKKGYGQHFFNGISTPFTFIPGNKIVFVIGGKADRRLQGRYSLNQENVSLKGDFFPRNGKDSRERYEISGHR